MPAVEILNAEISEHVKKKGEVEEREVETVIALGNQVLHRSVDAEDVERLDQEVDQDQQADVEQEFAVHTRGRSFGDAYLFLFKCKMQNV